MSQGMGGRKEEGSRELTSIGHGGARQLRGQREVLFMPTGYLLHAHLVLMVIKMTKLGHHVNE